MNLDEIQGQPRAVRCLKAALEQGRLGGGYFFFGPPGVGKRTAAFAFARAITCQRPPGNGASCGECDSCKETDRGLNAGVLVIGPEAGSQRSRAFHAESISEAIIWASRTAYRGRNKVCILEDVHLMSQEASNHFLKMLEEPPPGTVWLLLTSVPRRVRDTIRSRCQPVRFTLLARAVAEKLARERGWSEEQARTAGELGMMRENLESEVSCRAEADRMLGMAAAGDLAGFCSLAQSYGRKEEKENLGPLLEALEHACAARLRSESARFDAWIAALDAVAQARFRLAEYFDKTLMDALGAEMILALKGAARG